MLGFGRTAQAQGDPADDDICAFLGAQGRTILEDGLFLQFLSHPGALGAAPGADNLIEGSFDFGLPSSGGAINSANDDPADSACGATLLCGTNNLDTEMPGGGGNATMGYDETGPDASDVNTVGGPGALVGDPAVLNTDGTLHATRVRACDDSPLPAGACAAPHGAFSHSQIYVLRCDDASPCRSDADCVGIGSEVCNKIVVRQGYVSGSLSAISKTVQSNELVGEGLDATGALTPGSLLTTTAPQRFDAYIVTAGPDARIRTDVDNRAECVDAGFPFGAFNGVGPGEDGMSSWVSTISADLPLRAFSNEVFWRLGNVRPRTPHQRILRFTGDLMLKMPGALGPTTGAFNASETWNIGWLMPFTEAIALLQQFPNGDMPDLVLDQRGPDGVLNSGDEVILPGDNLARYISEMARQVVASGGFDKSTELLIGYFTVYVELSPDTCVAAGAGCAPGEAGYFQQFIVATGGLLRVDVCAVDADDDSVCPRGLTPVMRGGRCEPSASPADGQFCFSDGFCETLGAPAGTRCLPNPNVTQTGVTGVVIQGSDGN